MLNGLIDVPVTDSMTLSFGGGVGIDFVSWDHQTDDANDSSLAYQGIAEVSFALTDTIDLTLDYRYVSVPDVALSEWMIGNGTHFVSVAVDELDAQSVSLGVRFAL